MFLVLLKFHFKYLLQFIFIHCLKWCLCCFSREKTSEDVGKLTSEGQQCTIDRSITPGIQHSSELNFLKLYDIWNTSCILMSSPWISWKAAQLKNNEPIFFWKRLIILVVSNSNLELGFISNYFVPVGQRYLCNLLRCFWSQAISSGENFKAAVIPTAEFVSRLRKQIKFLVETDRPHGMFKTSLFYFNLSGTP